MILKCFIFAMQQTVLKLMLDPICVKGLLSSWMTVKTQKAISYYIVA